MFGKLMKYELRYLIRIFAPMWTAVAILSVLTRVTIGPKLKGENLYLEGNEAILPAVIGVITVFAIMTMMIVAAVVLIQRFYKGMYGDEGYLMFTLPVTTGQLVHSKALSALLMMLGTELLTTLAVMIMVSYPQIWEYMRFEWSDAFQIIQDLSGFTGAQLILFMFWAVLAFLISMTAEIYKVYLAISVGQLWKKHPVAGGIIAYYVLALLFAGLQTAINHNSVFNLMQVKDMCMILLFTTSYSLLTLVICFFGTKLLLDRKLNIA